MWRGRASPPIGSDGPALKVVEVRRLVRGELIVTPPIERMEYGCRPKRGRCWLARGGGFHWTRAAAAAAAAAAIMRAPCFSSSLVIACCSWKIRRQPR